MGHPQSEFANSRLLNSKHFHLFVVKVIDDFDRDATALGFVEGAAGMAAERMGSPSSERLATDCWWLVHP
jgi:hypothetical protein